MDWNSKKLETYFNFKIKKKNYIQKQYTKWLLPVCITYVRMCLFVSSPRGSHSVAILESI